MITSGFLSSGFLRHSNCTPWSHTQTPQEINGIAGFGGRVAASKYPTVEHCNLWTLPMLRPGMCMGKIQAKGFVWMGFVLARVLYAAILAWSVLEWVDKVALYDIISAHMYFPPLCM
jgi:hypothetical protein